MRLRALAAALVLACTAAGCSGAGGSGDSGRMSITVGLPGHDSSYAPVYLALDKGFFRDEGLEVKLVAFQSGSDLSKAVIGGSVDIADGALSEMITAVQQRQPLKAFWGGMNMLTFSWWARPPIRTVADARGKRWGVTRVGSSSDFLTRYLMTRDGLNPERDATIVSVGQSAGAQAAMEADQIQVSEAAQPNNFVYADRGYVEIGSQADFSDSYPTHVSYSREQFQRDNAPAVEAYLRAVVRGTQLAMADRAAAQATMMAYDKVDPKYVARTYDENRPGWAVNGALPPAKDMDVFWDIGIQNKQFARKLPEQDWLNRRWLDAYPNLGTKPAPHQ